jgi:hypothetical protein
MNSYLDHELFRNALIGVLIQKLGGRVRLDQSDFDGINGKMLMEDAFPDGSIEFYVEERQ